MAGAAPPPAASVAHPPASGALGQHSFRVLLYDLRCDGLAADERSDYYLRMDFAGFKAFRTNCERGASSVQWNFEAGFEYSLASLEKLACQELRVQCLGRGSEQPLGEAAVNLATLACGPMSVQLTLRCRRGGTSVGTVSFACQMRQRSQNLTVTCTDLNLIGHGGSPMPARLVACCSGAGAQLALPLSETGCWPGPCTLAFDTTLGDLLKAPPYEFLRFSVINESDGYEGEAVVEFRRAFPSERGAAVPFRVPVLFAGSADGQELAEPEHIGELTGSVMYQNLPTYAQMVGGMCVDGQVEGGYILIEGLPFPGSLGQPPPLWRDRTEQQDDDAQMQQDEEVGAFDESQLMKALEKIPLPRPWEMRHVRRSRLRSRCGGLGRPYFADPRSRRTTFVDPRLLPEHWDQRIDPQSGRVYYQFDVTRQTTFVDPRACPPDWEMRISKTGGVYFAYSPTEQSTFIDPRGLPEHMSAALDRHGRMYFMDHTAKGTTWNDPRDVEKEPTLTRWRRAEHERWWKDEVWQEIERQVDDVARRDLRMDLVE